MNEPQPWWLTWPVAEVAAAILPVFSSAPCSPKVTEDWARAIIVDWCRTGSFGKPRLFYSRTPFDDPDMRAIAEAMQVLERACLLMRCQVQSSTDRNYVGLTRLGMHALQTNTVRQHLGLGDAPPTA